MTDKIIVLCTCKSAEQAAKIATVLVELRLAACSQVAAPVQSTYWWEGQVVISTEYPVLLKSIAAKFQELRAKIEELHSYEVPEILAIPVSHGSAAYLNWIGTEVNA